MRRASPFALVLFGCLAIWLAAGPRLIAQTPATGDAKGQSKPTGASKKQAQSNSSQPGSTTQSSNNPFPEDTSTVPVMPSTTTPPLPEGMPYHAPESSPVPWVPLPSEDVDPVRSPDDPAPAASGPEAEFSSSLTGVERLLPKSGDDDQTSGKKRKLLVIKEPTHQEVASKDIEVGSYYLQTKNWKAALSRFESAMILDPENPEVYWGLAEAEHHLGDFAHAKEHYLKLLEYDPDGPHGKQARKELKDPALNKAQSGTPGQPAAATPK
jgi:tetratricopeptide (TPR) repeat protein